MLGRERLFKKLCHRLTEHNICVVGPPSFGKSVLLHHLASHFEDTSNHYVIPLCWDLHRRDTPRTDDEFRQRFAKRIKEALQPVQPDLAEYLELEDESLPDFLHFVFEEMEGKKMEGKKICFLAILDGFDDVLAESNITGNLWEEMYDLGHRHMDSLRLVTGSRSSLSELYFSELFHYNPLPVGCFEDHDWSGFLDPLKSRRRITFDDDDSVRQEIASWTGGVPVLAVALAEQIFDKFSDVTISESDVQRIAEELDGELWELRKDLWKDCPIDLQSDLVALASRREVQLPKERRADLKLRGFAKKSRKDRLRSSCLLMKQYAQEQEGEVSYLQWLFGDAERFESNIQSLLDRRLTQIRGADSELMSYVKSAIQDLQPTPTKSVVWARSIAERALDLIWENERPEENRSKWESVGVRFDEGGRFPRRRAWQCDALRLITGTEDHAPVSKFVTKQTCLFVDHLRSVGNFGQHREGSPVSVPIAAAFCMSAISLCESLARDLANTATEEE